MPKYVMRDNDTKFTAQLDEVLKTSDVKIKRNTPLSPNHRGQLADCRRSAGRDRLMA